MKRIIILLSIILSVNCIAEGKFLPFTDIDRQFINQQFESINDIAKLQIGVELKRDKRDLDVIQKIVDRNLIDKKNKLQTQAMGAVLGEVLLKELNLTWAVWEDEYGRSRALRLGQTDHLLFPNTMISRRLEVDLNVNIQEIYQRNYDVIYNYKINPQLQKTSLE